MTQYGAPFDGILTGDATVAPYSSTEWARIWKLQHGAGASFQNYGVFEGSGGGVYPPLFVNAKSPVSTNIEVEIGAAQVNGHFYETTAVETFVVGANASGNARIDTVILRLDYVANTIRLALKQGTPAGSPVAPVMQQDAVIWEIPLADIAVANGFSVINQTDITNRQRSVQGIPAGWQQVANPPGYFVGVNYDAASTPLSVAVGQVAVPFVLTGNMLINDVQIRHLTTAITYNLDWGLYKQDTNEGLTAENTLRRVAYGSGTAAVGGTTTINLPATPAPQVVPPGIYWLVLHWLGSGTLALGATAGGNFEYFNSLLYTTISTGLPLAQTLDMVTNWAISSASLAIRLRGRVFGRTTV